MRTHEITIVRSAGLYQAACYRCGWRGEPHWDHVAAEHQGRTHLRVAKLVVAPDEVDE